MSLMQAAFEFSAALAANKANGVSRVANRFSIEEILKPSFGANHSKEASTCCSQPLDMRTARNDKNTDDFKRETAVERNCSVSLDESRSTELDISGHSSPSLDSNSSSSRDSTSSEHDELYGSHKLRRRNEHESPHWKQPLLSQSDLNCLASSAYYNAINYIYNYDITRSHLYSQFQPMKNVFHPHTTYSNVPISQKCSSFYLYCVRDNSVLSKCSNTASVLSSALPPTSPESNANWTVNLRNNKQNGLSIQSSINTSYERSGNTPEQSTQEASKSYTNYQTESSAISKEKSKDNKRKDPFVWPAWVYCTRYSDRPSSGPRYRKPRTRLNSENEKRPRTAFSSKQLHQLTLEFEASPYLSENRRQTLSLELGLTESQVKIWFQNKRAKLKKSSGSKNLLAQRLLEEGLYNHSTIVVEAGHDHSTIVVEAGQDHSTIVVEAGQDHSTIVVEADQGDEDGEHAETNS